MVGCVPVVGAVANVVNAGISVGRGDWAGAGLSIVSCIPGAGPFLKGGKWAKGIVNATSKFAKGSAASKAMNVVQKARNIAQHAFQFVLDKIKSVKGKVFSGSRSGTSSKDLQEMLGKLSDRMQAVLGGQGSLGRKLATDFAVGSTRLLVEDYLYENYGIDLPFFSLNRKAFSTKLGATSRGRTSKGSGQTSKKQGNKGTGDSQRPIPGTPGVVTGGNSTKLGKNMMEEMGLKRSQKWSGYQAQHIIPSKMKNNQVIKKIGMDFDNASNGIFLRVPNNDISTMARHQGYHSVYNEVVEKSLNRMDINQSIDVLQKQVFDLQKNLKHLQQKGLPLYPDQGATVELWERKLGQLMN